MRNWLTDEEVEREIAALSEDKDVRLARAEMRKKYKQRQRLYTLRNLKKRGAELRLKGLTEESFSVEIEDIYEGEEV